MESSLNGSSHRSVVLVDDHGIVRHAVKTIIEGTKNYVVVGEARTADEAVEQVKDTDPDFLVIDIGLPGKSGIEAIYEIRSFNTATKIIVLTMYEDEPRVKQALLAGANAYVLKSFAPKEFVEAMQNVSAGKVYLPDRFQSIIREVEIARKNNESPMGERDPLEKLSKREREVFYMLADGMPNRIIAKKLFISPRTVETHRARVIKKLGFGSTADLIRYAIRNNLLTL